MALFIMFNVLRLIVSLLFRFLAAKIAPRTSLGDSFSDSSAAHDDNPPNPPADFRIYKHDVRYTYSCYLSTDIEDLVEATEKLLATGLALLVTLPDGQCAWKLGDQTVFGDLEEEDSGNQKTQFRLPITLDPALRGKVARTALMRSAERSIFQGNEFPESYIRIFLPEMRVCLDDTDAIDLEIEIKLFESGILLLALCLSEYREMDLQTYIERRVNLGHFPLAAIELPPDLAYLMMDAAASECASSHSRLKILRVRKAVRKAFEAEMRDDGSRFVHLTGKDTSQLGGVALELVQTLAYCLGKPRSGIAYLIRGEPCEPKWTGYWNASPHIHLLHFSGQQTSAFLNEELHHSELARILSRRATGKLAGVSLPENLRKFDDVGIYANEALLLWVYAGLTEEPIIDGTHEYPLFSPILQHEVKGEVVEFVPMLYRSLLHELEGRDLSWDRVLSAWERITSSELALFSVGKFGEVRESIKKCLEIRGLSELRQISVSKLTLRESAASVKETRRLSAVGAILTVTVGSLGLPGFIRFINDGILPVLGWGGLNPLRSLLLSGTIGIVFVGALSTILFAVAMRRQWVRWRWRRKRS